MRLSAAILVVLLAAGAGVAVSPAADRLHAASQDKLVAAGKLKLAGRSMRCGRTPTQISPTFWDYGGATKGKIILNPVKLAGLPEPVRWWIYAHECGHQLYGAREIRADCYAVERGRREKWLDSNGMDSICEFLKDRRGDYVHPPGPKRCKLMRQCFDKAKPQRASR